MDNISENEERVVRQCVEALVFERIVSSKMLHKKLSIFIGSWVCADVQWLAFNRVKIRPFSLKNDKGECVTLDDICTFLVKHGWHKSVLFLHSTFEVLKWNEGLNRVYEKKRRTMNFYEIEQCLYEGHFYHPYFKARLQFSEHDHYRYSPERRQYFQMEWLAIPNEMLMQQV
ncbi:MAG: IucA/IucC family protein, partial [Bacilli bacterium]